MNNLDFCCDRMMDSANNAEIPIVFTPKFREFGIRVLDGGTSTVQLLFCPWCAQLLPSSLRDEWFDELESLGIDPISREVPEEFQDSRWYLDRQQE